MIFHFYQINVLTVFLCGLGLFRYVKQIAAFAVCFFYLCRVYNLIVCPIYQQERGDPWHSSLCTIPNRTKWKEDILGFGDSRDTIGYVGCALTSVAMLISGHGFVETPRPSIKN